MSAPDTPDPAGSSAPEAPIVLGTAGHIDHGKTALVRALTGVDTDRLSEEKARGITIELGFAELAREDGPGLGVVDVPGHEGFVRAMVAGATGMDLALLVVAADEGVMPQTREHLAVIGLLDVPDLVVALTKADLVEEEWLELVAEEVREVLEGTAYAEAPMVATSVHRDDTLAALRDLLFERAARARGRRSEDLVRLPVDRAFTVQGTGTVVTGTLWSGALGVGDAVRVLPEGAEARVRGLEVHGRAVDRATAGSRTAVALAGPGLQRRDLERGSTLVTASDWEASPMLTVRARVLDGTGWRLEHNQRVHVHLGTQVVLARVAVLEAEDVVAPGSEGWIQLRLEAPAVARVGDRVVLRSYSPVTTLGGGAVAEIHPPKRRRLAPEVLDRLEVVLQGDGADAVQAALSLASWEGRTVASLALHVPLAEGHVPAALDRAVESGAARAAGRAWGEDVVEAADQALLSALAAAHEAEPLKDRVPLAALRTALPDWTGGGLADARIEALAAAGRIDAGEGGARLPGHEVRLTPDQERASEALRRHYADAGLAPPALVDLPEEWAKRPDLEPLLRHLEARGTLAVLDDGVWIDRDALDSATERVRVELAGRKGLGPADFRDVLPVTRKHLIPLLAHLDRSGVTLRRNDGRDVTVG